VRDGEGEKRPDQGAEHERPAEARDLAREEADDDAGEKALHRRAQHDSHDLRARLGREPGGQTVEDPEDAAHQHCQCDAIHASAPPDSSGRGVRPLMILSPSARIPFTGR